MRQRPMTLLSKPAFLVGLTALLTALVIQPGGVGSIDTQRRLQATRSFWTSAPPVAPGDMALIGRNGQLHYWYGMGQSVLMLPADILAQGAIGLISRFREPPPWLSEETIVSYITSTVVCVLAVMVCFNFLRLLAFTANQSLAGACCLLFGTTFLHYVQNMQENNFLLLLTLTGFYFQYDWFKNGSTRSLFWGSIAFGANLLTRVTSGLDFLAGGLFIFLCLWRDEARKHAMLHRVIEYGRISVPCYMAFFIIDRLYQYYRFGSLSGTYIDIFAQQFVRNHPGVAMPTGWPWTTPFWTGFLGPFVTPQKSIFLFDPLIVLTIALALTLRKRLAPEIRAYLTALVCLLLSYIAFYARYYDWGGDTAWGDRFVTTPVQMLAMISIPLLMRYRVVLKSSDWKLGKAIAATSLAIQLASVFFWHLLEFAQMEALGHPTFVIGLRFWNIIAFAFRIRNRLPLNSQYTQLYGWRVGSGTPYLFPFLVMREGTATRLELAVLICSWACLVAALIGLLFLIRAPIRRAEEST